MPLTQQEREAAGTVEGTPRGGLRGGRGDQGGRGPAHVAEGEQEPKPEQEPEPEGGAGLEQG
jgi:hypothetical protein